MEHSLVRIIPFTKLFLKLCLNGPPYGPSDIICTFSIVSWYKAVQDFISMQFFWNLFFVSLFQPSDSNLGNGEPNRQQTMVLCQILFNSLVEQFEKSRKP